MEFLSFKNLVPFIGPPLKLFIFFHLSSTEVLFVYGMQFVQVIVQYISATYVLKKGFNEVDVVHVVEFYF
jgi:hypothetical protein